MAIEPCLSGGPEDNPFTAFMRDPAPPADIGLPNYLINTATLALVIQDTFFRYQGHGPEMKGTITYHSSAGRPGMFGLNWWFSYESRVVEGSDSVTLVKGSGQVLKYRPPPSRGRPETPAELVPLGDQTDRLLDCGTHLLFIEKQTFLVYRYDRSAGRPASPLSSISDPNGNTVTAGYSPAGFLETLTDPDGRVIRFTTDAAGRCTSLLLPDGRNAAFRYDTRGLLQHTTDLGGIPARYLYDTANRIVSMIVAKDKKTIRFTYLDLRGEAKVESVTDAAGIVTRYDLLSDSPRRVRVTDAEGNVTVYQSTSRGLTETIESRGTTVRFAYDGQGRRTSATTRTGRTTRFEYNARGNIARIIQPDGTQVSCSWNESDRMVSLSDPLGNTTRFLYDDLQNLSEIITPSGFRHAYTCDIRGQVATYISPAGRNHTFTYDRFGNLAGQTSPGGGRFSLEYDAYGLRLTGVIDTAGNRTAFTFDNNNRLVRITFSDGSTREHTYGCCAGLSSKDENGAVVKYVRDPRLLVTEMCDAAGNTTRFTYDTLHRITSVTRPRGAVTAIAFSDRDGSIRVTDPTGNAISCRYDSDGNLLSVLDPEGELFRFAYDPCGLMTGCSDAGGGSEEYRRDAAGRVVSIRSGPGSTVDYEYSPDGHIIQKMHDGLVVADYGYDNDGNLVTMDDLTGRTTFFRDPCGLLSAITYPDKKTVSFTYDLGGHAASVRYPDGTDVVYAYDSRERITSVRWDSGEVRFAYDRAGNVTGMSRSNGVDTACKYTVDDHLAGIRHAHGDTLLADIEYTRDADRNVTEERAFLPFQPNPVPRSFAARCNRIGQIVTLNGRAVTYNAGGCLTADGTGLWEAAYDPENRLIRIMRNGRVQEFTYNGLGQRTGIRSETGDRTLHYDLSGRLLFETDRQGTVVCCYIYAGNILLARQRPGSGPGFYHFDRIGNTICITTPAGDVEAAYAFDTHGLVSAGATQNPDTNPFTFVGMFGVMDDGDGLFFMENRHYDAVTGRFLQRDPIGIRGGLNLYAYAANNPVNVIDPEGTIAPALIYIGGMLILVSFGAVGYSTAQKIQKSLGPSGGHSRRSWDAAMQRIADPKNVTPEKVQQVTGPKHPQKVIREIESALGTHAEDVVSTHTVFGPGAEMAKAATLARQGKYGDALISLISAVPNMIGEIVGTTKDVAEAAKAGRCKVPK